ncbi:MAG: Hsp70 family protein [Geobacter sp.]|nr:Hsp70 family protein [Geobacter sp.]
MSRIIGIDLGTTNTVVAFLDSGCPVIVPNAEGGRLTPSVVAFTDGGVVTGSEALRNAGVNPEETIASVKRRMGTSHRFHLRGGIYTPQEISGMILQKVAGDAGTYLGERIDKAVITVPAYFNNEQREATREAGVMAGLEVVRIINEPTAAALAYGLDKEEIHTVLVWDLGGGTFDVSILELGQGVFEVRAVSGDTRLGGDDWDQRLAGHLAGMIETETGIDPFLDKSAVPILKRIAEGAKKTLSDALLSDIDIPLGFRGEGNFAGRNVRARLSREEFEALTAPLLKRLAGPTIQALSDAGLRPIDIDRVILVGGATRMPAVRELARQMFGDSKICHDRINPDEVVAAGAAIQGGILAGEFSDLVLVDVTPLSLGIETQGGVFARIIDRNTRIPVSRNKIFTTAADDQASVSIHVLQGEKDAVSDNMSLGIFDLADIPPAPQGEPKIEVTFNIDVNGILRVSAVDLHTGNEQKIEVAPLHPSASIE